MVDSSKFVDKEILEELKHSIRIHLLLMQGPTQQLCAMLLKLLDIMGDSDQVRRNNEAMDLAFNIVEGTALYVQRFIDDKAEKFKEDSSAKNFKSYGDKILIAVGWSRQSTDKKLAKMEILKSVAEALRALGSFTDSKYPDIYDSNGIKL